MRAAMGISHEDYLNVRSKIPNLYKFVIGAKATFFSPSLQVRSISHTCSS